MHILLTMGLPYEPVMGGASKTNRSLAEMLVRRGHSVRAVVPASEANTSQPSCQNLRDYLTSRGILFHNVTGGCHFELHGVDVHALDTSAALPRYLAAQLREFQPDCVLVSSEDSMQLLLSEALKYDSSRVVYLAHTPSCLPFGPYSFRSSRRGSLLLNRVSAVITVSRFCANYIRQWSDLDPVQIYLPIYGQPPYPRLGQFKAGFVTLINPCAYKGIDIFIDLAKWLDDVRFAAVPSWGTTSADMARIQMISNIQILEPSADIDVFLRDTSVLLVPSLWLENFPLVITEAMLRGIPVIASDIGGIPEVKLGTNYLLPIRPIEHFRKEWDANKLWVPIVPPQDTSPWRVALRKLMSDQAAYELESSAAKEASERFVTSLSFDPFEQIINQFASPLSQSI